MKQRETGTAGTSVGESLLRLSEQQEPGADARLSQYLADAKWEAARRNADDERAQIDPA